MPKTDESEIRMVTNGQRSTEHKKRVLFMNYDNVVQCTSTIACTRVRE